MARVKIGLTVDDRTSEMSTTAIRCRRYGHRWDLKATPRKRYLELLRRGIAEENRYCSNGCGGTWQEVFDINSGSVLEKVKKYPTTDDYRMPRGTGRLSRDAARVALFARLHPEVV